MGVQDDLDNNKSVLELLSMKPLDDKEEDGNGKDWFLIMNEDAFDDVGDLEKS